MKLEILGVKGNEAGNPGVQGKSSWKSWGSREIKLEILGVKGGQGKTS
jgi:hypothetical protein